LIEHLAANGGKVKRAYGVDISPNMLRIAEKCAKRMGMPISWIEASAYQTGLPSASISLVTAFNAIHHLPTRETLDEVARIARPKALFAVYTRLREQEAEQLWGRWFPGYLDHSINPVRDIMLKLSQQNEGFRLIDTRDFTFYRETTLAEVRELTENRFYSTLSRYSESEFGRAYARFIANLKSNFEDPKRIRYPSSYSVFLYEVCPSAA
jgi:ubiquinone/menaquinone biosynthesis C-methylase UbiE